MSHLTLEHLYVTCDRRAFVRDTWHATVEHFTWHVICLVHMSATNVCVTCHVWGDMSHCICDITHAPLWGATPHHDSTPLLHTTCVCCVCEVLLHTTTPQVTYVLLHTTTPHHYSTPLLHTTTPHHLYVTSPALLICEQTNRYVTYVYGTWSYGTWLIHMGHHSFIWDMTHSYGTCLIHMWYDSFVCHVPHLYFTWLIHVSHDSFICDITHPYVTWLTHKWHDSCTCDII